MSHVQLTVRGLTAVIGGEKMQGETIPDGALVEFLTSPGCWGPMITPGIVGGHEVTSPVMVEGAQVGDSIALSVEKIEVLSQYAASGTSRKILENFDFDPSLYAKCPHCQVHRPETVVSGIGEQAVRCKVCGAAILPQTFANGYTVAIDESSGLGVAVDAASAERIAHLAADGKSYLPPDSKQHLATLLAHADTDQMVLRRWPMIGNIGCIPAKEIPSSKNSGDLIEGLNATGLYEKVSANDITDGHMDISHIGVGCVVLSPVRVKGGGVYVGDVHYLQGAGELAGHTLDISARVWLRIKLLKGVTLPGPVVLPAVNELDPRFAPLSEEEFSRATSLRSAHCAEPLERGWPIQVVGTGKGVDAAIESAVQRASALIGISPDEVKNRATVTGGVGIGRTTGSVFLTLVLPESRLRSIGLLDLAQAQYAVL